MPSTAEVVFGPYRLDSRGKSAFCGCEQVGLSPCEFEVLHLLVRSPNVVLSKDVLIRAGWQDTAVGDNSLEKLVSKLRRHLDADDLSATSERCRGRGISSSRRSRRWKASRPRWI